MKKLVTLGLILILSGCDDNSKEPVKTTKPSATVTKIPAPVADTMPKADVMNVETIVNQFKKSGLSVGQIVVYDEKTDPNKMLNRPNQYTQKISFEDSSIEQPTPELVLEGNIFNGGTIEVFPSEKLAKGRKEYIEMVTKDIPTIQQYIYINGKAVLRLEHEVLPSDAKKYQKIFMSK